MKGQNKEDVFIFSLKKSLRKAKHQKSSIGSHTIKVKEKMKSYGNNLMPYPENILGFVTTYKEKGKNFAYIK